MDALPTVKHEKIKLLEINEYLTCPLCKGYFIDATTISECLHSFCRSCIIQFLQRNSHCPICEVIINKAKPNIKLDKTLQDIVYKLVPELFLREMARRQRFYGQRPELAAKVTPEERGEDTERTIFNPKDLISLSIEYISDDSTPGAISVPAPLDTSKNSKICDNDSQMKRFLQCPGMCRIEVLKKFVQNKYNVNTVSFHIEILYKRVPLPNHYTLIDIAYIYSWKRNEPMKFFFRIMEKSAVETIENTDEFVNQEVFVKPVKPIRNVDKSKSARGQNKKRVVVSNPAKKIQEDVILNTDKIKDEIKNKLQDIGKGPVYTNITLNRSNNVEIITKVQKVSNKNGQPIGLNIIKQTVKKNTRPPDNHSPSKDEKLTEKPTQLTNGCKPDFRLGEDPKKREESLEKNVKKDVNIISKKENANSPKKEDGKSLKHPRKSFDNKNGIKEENLKGFSETPSRVVKEESELDHDRIIENPEDRIKRECYNQQNDNKENHKEKIEKIDIQPIKEEKISELTVNEIKHEVNDNKDENSIVIQTVVKKKDFDIDEEKSNFLKSIELTARTALQTIQGIKSSEKSAGIVNNPIPMLNPGQKSSQKRKNSSPIKNDRKKPKKTKNSVIKLLPNLVTPSVDKIVLLAEKQKNGGDLQSLFSSCKINIPSSLSITLKESSEDDRDRRNAASLKPVQNYIEILKLPDANHYEAVNNDVDNRFKSRSAPSLPCKVNPVSSKEVNKHHMQTFQKMFEDSIKKTEVTNPTTSEDGVQTTPSKRNLMEITSQLHHKKTKLEIEKTYQKLESLPKVPIPRLNPQKKPATSSSKRNQSKFQQTFANLHSASLGLNYTVSVAQNSNKSPGKIEAKVENRLKSPPKIEEVKHVEEAQNLIMRDEKIEDHNKSNNASLNLSNQNHHQACSPRLNNTKVTSQSRQVNLSPRPPNLSPRPANLSPIPPNLSPRPNMSPIPNIPSPRLKMSPEKPPTNSGTSQNLQVSSPFSPNHILEKYNIQNLAQLTASLNFNSAVFGMNHTSQLAALQQAVLFKQFELQNRQNWQLSPFEKYLQNRLLSKEN